MTTHITDHTARILDNLLPRWREGALFRALMAVFGDELQELEDLSYNAIVQRFLSSAVGVQLDHYGELVGQVRNGRTDAEYRAVLEVRILANRSPGTPDVITQIAAVMLDSKTTGVRYAQNQPAAYQIQATPDSALTALQEADAVALLRHATPAGVEISQVTTSPSAGAFRFGSGGTGSRGFGNGQLASRIDK